MVSVSAMKQLVNLETGLFDRRIYTDPDIYQQELEQVFGRCWVGVGHTSHVPNPNDFHAAYIAEDPILVTRDSKGKIHAFLNMCRHRGNRVCRTDFGNAPSFMCTYHGWTFDTAGKLVGVPGYKEAYFEELDRTQWGLVEVAQIDSYKGLIFATWDKHAPPLIDYLGDAAWYMDVNFDRTAGGTVALPGVQKHMVGANWKIPCDNVGGDGYHFPTTHGSVIATRARGTMQRAAGFNSDPRQVTVYTGNGHIFLNAYNGVLGPEGEGANLQPVVAEYYKQKAAETRERLGEVRASQSTRYSRQGNIFPATSYIFSGPSLRLRIPRGPLKTEEWTYCLVDKDAPAEVKAIQERNAVSGFGPAGLIEMDDANNWNSVTMSGKILRGIKEPMGFQQGLGHEKKSELIPGILGPGAGESNQRGFYGFWAEMMGASSWQQVSLTPKTRA